MTYLWVKDADGNWLCEGDPISNGVLETYSTWHKDINGNWYLAYNHKEEYISWDTAIVSKMVKQNA